MIDMGEQIIILTFSLTIVEVRNLEYISHTLWILNYFS